AMRSVRECLLAGADSSDEQFLSLRPCDDSSLLLETRAAIAQFFDVPCDKIQRNVRLIEDLHVNELEPGFHTVVVEILMAARFTEPRSYRFTMARIHSIDDLTRAIRQVLDRCEREDDHQRGA